MSSTRRYDTVDRASLTDESQTFKKAHQTVDRPPVTERDIHEQYMQDPPHVSSRISKYLPTPLLVIDERGPA